MPTRLRHSLRARLILAFMALVSLILVVGLAALSSNKQVQDDVADLQAGLGTDLARLDLATLGLEIKGRWDAAGSFVAREVEVYPGARRPKLRGALEAVDTEARRFTLYGREILVDDSTAFPTAAPDSLAPPDLHPGMRVEVTCDVDDEGTWSAREIWTQDVKDSDKIKGTATAWDIDGVIPESLEIHGLQVTLALPSETAPDSALRHVEIATQLMLAAHDCRAAAHALVGRTAPDEGSAASSQLDHDVLLPTSLADRLRRVSADFAYYVGQAAGTDGTRGQPDESTARWVSRLSGLIPELDAHVDRLLQLASTPAKARRYLDEVLDPYLTAELQPIVHAFVNHSQEELGEQLESLVARSDDTARFALWMTAVAALAAMLLAYLIWRSISRPIQALHRAAGQLAQGRLDTRVSLPRQDEFGDLASAFNQMAEELAKSTVSIGEKELLLREVHHRVKNNMQVISSLLEMQADSVGDSRMVGPFAESQNRVRSMSLIHEQLYQSSDLANIDVRTYIEVLTSQLAHSFGTARKVEIDLEVEDLDLDIDQSLSCGLIINELVVNAYKHAFPDEGGGSIRVSLKRDPQGDALLSVSDNGQGLVATLESSGRQGLGTSLIRMLVKQLRGTMSVDSADGADVKIHFPITEALTVRADS